MDFHLKLIFSCALLITQQVVSQYEGDFCVLQSTGASGQCVVISQCPRAIQDLQINRVSPQICGFKGTLAIVCCVGNNPPITEATTPRVTTSRTKITTPTTSRSITEIISKGPIVSRPGDKARSKCKEYEKYGYEYITVGGPPTSDCKISKVTLIVGGTKAEAKEFPHMALIGYDNENNQKVWQCGGSLVSEQFVLTAAHCLFHREFKEARHIRLGELTLYDNTDDADPRDYRVSDRIRHPKYKPPSQYNDIALLKLERRAQLSTYARPACIDTDVTTNFRRHPVATGWGKVGFTEDVSDYLQKVTLEYFSHADCNYAYRNNRGNRLATGIDDQTQLCAGSRNESKDTCQGDSGGPLQIVNLQGDCMYTIVGVTSFGKACGTVNIPGVYTRVASYVEWIESVVWPS